MQAWCTHHYCLFSVQRGCTVSSCFSSECSHTNIWSSLNNPTSYVCPSFIHHDVQVTSHMEVWRTAIWGLWRKTGDIFIRSKLCCACMKRQTDRQTGVCSYSTEASLVLCKSFLNLKYLYRRRHTEGQRLWELRMAWDGCSSNVDMTAGITIYTGTCIFLVSDRNVAYIYEIRLVYVTSEESSSVFA